MITNKDKNIIRKCCNKSLLHTVSKSKILKTKLNFNEHVDMARWVNNLTYEESISYVFNNGKMLSEFGIRDFEGKFSKFIKYGLAAIAGGILTPLGASKKVGIGVSMLAVYLFRKATDPCWQNCLRKFSGGAERKVCKYTCQSNAAKKIVQEVRSQISKCQHTKNPLACEKKLNKEYIKWSQKVETQLVKLQQAKIDLARKSSK